MSILLHGSSRSLPVGTLLTPQGLHVDRGGAMEASRLLEMFRPHWCLRHADMVFMAGTEEDLDNCGADLDHVYAVRPEGRCSRHDLSWSSEISMALDRHPFPAGLDDAAPEIASAARSYWSGMPHPAGPVWEYLAASAEILAEIPEGVDARHVIDPMILRSVSEERMTPSF